MKIKFKDSIRKLDLSARSTNALYKSGITTIEQLLNTPKKKIENIYGLGVKSIGEVSAVTENLKVAYGIGDLGEDREPLTFTGSDGVEYLDIELEKLCLSRRAYNCLRKVKVNYFSELVKIGNKELMNIKNFGIISLDEVNKIKKTIKLEPAIGTKSQKSDTMGVLSKGNREFIIRVAEDLDLDEQDIFSFMLDDNIDGLNKIRAFGQEELNNSDLLPFLLEMDNFRNSLTKIVLDSLDSKAYGLHIEEVEKSIPKIIRCKELVDTILNELMESGKIDFILDDRLMIKKEPFTKAGFRFLSKREFNILRYRINGWTLEKIGDIYNVSRERIRQIESAARRKLKLSSVTFREDMYRHIFQTYKLEKKDYFLALGNNKTYNYLNIRYKVIEGKDAEDILADKNIPVVIRKQFEKAIYKDYIKIGNKRVKKTRDGLVAYILKNFARNDMHFDTFKDVYLTLVDDLNLSNLSNLGILDRGYENRLIASDKVLWQLGRTLRYYNQDIFDFTNLLEALDLNQYVNVEYSSLKFFRQYPELMQDYDIRNEYELHNLLKKICKKKDYPHIKFGRMPNIKFGESNRDKQVKELLYLLAPISSQDFAKEYEKEYGVAANTVLANCVGGIEEYFHHGDYIVNFPDMPEGLKNDLRDTLTEDMYFIEDVMSEAIKLHPGVESEKINPISLKSLGFIVYEKYIISEKYSTATQYFNHVLTSKDLVDLSKLDSRVKGLPVFSSYMYKLKEEYEIIEYLPDKYINFRRIETAGISKKMLNDFSHKVLNFLGEGKYFTMASLREKGFVHNLFDLGFEDWFYTSILIENRDRISYMRIGRNKLMLTGKHNFRFEDFIECIVYEQEDLYMDLYGLEDLLKNTFQLYVERHKLISIIKSSAMHYDDITECVYGDYEIYYEVI